jgi:hypothetical protein
MNRQHAHPRYLPPETREPLCSLFIGVVGILLVAFALLVVLPVAK